MSKFCHNCGKQMPAPNVNFCPFCGTSLASLAATPTPPPKKQATFTPFIAGKNDDDDEDDYIDHIEKLDIRINRLDVDIVRDRQLGETIGTIAQQGIKPNSEDLQRDTGPAVNSEDFLKEFKKEAGSLRPS